MSNLKEIIRKATGASYNSLILDTQQDILTVTNSYINDEYRNGLLSFRLWGTSSILSDLVGNFTEISKGVYKVDKKYPAVFCNSVEDIVQTIKKTINGKKSIIIFTNLQLYHKEQDQVIFKSGLTSTGSGAYINIAFAENFVLRKPTANCLVVKYSKAESKALLKKCNTLKKSDLERFVYRYNRVIADIFDVSGSFYINWNYLIKATEAINKLKKIRDTSNFVDLIGTFADFDKQMEIRDKLTKLYSDIERFKKVNFGYFSNSADIEKNAFKKATNDF